MSLAARYEQMDRILKAERKYLLKLCKAIKKTGCNVLLIQKSILRDAYNSLSMHMLAKLGACRIVSRRVACASAWARAIFLCLACESESSSIKTPAKTPTAQQLLRQQQQQQQQRC
jgi:chaperonin GroEL (HSP60 family)